MRIAFIVDSFPDLSMTFVIDPIVGLLGRGHHVDIFAQRPGTAKCTHPVVSEWGLDSRTRYIGPGERNRSLCSFLARAAFHPRRWPLLFRAALIGASREEIHPLATLAAVAALDATLDYDVVHCHFGPNGNIAAFLQDAGILRAPIVTTFHGYDMRFGERSNGECYTRLRRCGDAFLSISGYNRTLLELWGFPSSRLITHRVGIDLGRFQFRSPRNPSVDQSACELVTVANLYPVKGHTYMLSALGLLQERRPDLRFRWTCIGEGPELSRLEGQSESLQLESSVQFVGGLDQAHIRAALARSDVFVLPSIAEATPVALMEAQAVGLPVVATQVGAVNEVVSPMVPASLVAPKDAMALSQRIEYLMDHPEEWPDLASAGRQHIERWFDLERLIDQLESIYRGICGSTSPEDGDAGCQE